MIYIVSARKVPWVSMQRAAAGRDRVQGGGSRLPCLCMSDDARRWCLLGLPDQSGSQQGQEKEWRVQLPRPIPAARRNAASPMRGARRPEWTPSAHRRKIVPQYLLLLIAAAPLRRLTASCQADAGTFQP